MSNVIITGSSGLVGSEAVSFFCEKQFDVKGIDCDFRKYFFGEEASTDWKRKLLEEKFSRFEHSNIDIRDSNAIERIFDKYNSDIDLVIHTAAQPSHDWAAKEPVVDFNINANGTLNLLESTRKYAPNAVFIYTSTNKVYGDTPNRLPLYDKKRRWELENDHLFYEYGINEGMDIDNSVHSLFGVSKLSADLLVQEYGKYFGMKTACFRAGCITGPSHSSAQLHGFLAYLMKCAIIGKQYSIFGYKGKQVRDNIHCNDLVEAFYYFYKNPKLGEVYNIGGSRYSNCSILEAIDLCEEISGKKMKWIYEEKNRIGDHIWWISDIRKFKRHFPEWSLKYNVNDILIELYSNFTIRYS